MEMSRESDAQLGLAEYLTQLQAELSRALAQREADDIKFSVDGVTVELDIIYTLTQSAGSPTSVKPEFWLLGPGAQAGAGSAHRNQQHLIVQLTRKPETADEPEDVAAASLWPPTRSAEAE
jgi:hypothetical protein